ncbi:MAG: YfhO family protein, partial [Clostridiales bacterium]|nr:YfhO family protein [Clostridiales bacterium]
MKKQMKRRVDKIPYILLVWCMFLCWLFVWRQGVFGSKIDWISQHSVFPDYFRQLFYQTGNLATNFAPHLGGGQNLFYFSYYGLYHPIILLSYLLPFVKMGDYIMWSSMACYGLSVILFYYWIREKCSHRYLAAGIATMFSLAAPLLYHSYNHIMFVNYMPFLCLALMGTDAYLKKRKCRLLILGIVGMILSSFYFSIGGMLALVLYGVSEYIKKQEHLEFHKLALWLLQYGIHFIIAVLMCGILLVPTAFALKGERSQGLKLSLSWFLPECKPGKLVFSPHGIGLSIMAIIVLIRGLLYKTWKERFLSISILLLLTIPAFGYLLNGGLYAKTKVFIPFLPLVCYLFIPYLDILHEKYRRKIPSMLLCISIIVILVVDFGIHKEAQVMVSKDFYQTVTSKEIIPWMEQETIKDSSYYRTEELQDTEKNKANINRVHCLSQSISSIYSSAYNDQYAQFRNHVFRLNEPYRNNMMQPVTDNPCFLKFMGVKHLITKEKIPGYFLNKSKDGYEFWTAKDAIPVIYSSNQLLEESEYERIPFPENQTALIQTAVVPAMTERKKLSLKSIFHEITCQLPESKDTQLQICALSDGYEIAAEKDTELMLTIDKAQEEDLFAASFFVENLKAQEDMYINIENQGNLLTAEQHEYANHNKHFTYLLGVSKNQKQIKITLGKGSY